MSKEIIYKGCRIRMLVGREKSGQCRKLDKYTHRPIGTQTYNSDIHYTTEVLRNVYFAEILHPDGHYSTAVNVGKAKEYIDNYGWEDNDKPFNSRKSWVHFRGTF